MTVYEWEVVLEPETAVKRDLWLKSGRRSIDPVRFIGGYVARKERWVVGTRHLANNELYN